MTPTRNWLIAAIALASAAGTGCGNEEKPAVVLAPTSSALAPAKPATMESKKLTVDAASSKVDFLMDAPKEKIRGKVHGTTTGDLQVDFMDVTKSTALLTVDISGIEVFQTKADDGGKFGDEKKDATQNEHVLNWLEISPKTEEAARKKNAILQFSAKTIEVTGDKDLSKMKGPERKVMMKVTGDFLLHGHKAQKVVELEATFSFDGDKPTGVKVKSVKPFSVDLAEHDVKPRDTVGKLLQKGLEALAPKVAKEALVSVDFSAKLADAPTQPTKASP